MITRFVLLALAPFLLLAGPVSAAEDEPAKGKVVSCKGVKTSDWKAWNNLMPPPPNHFHIIGKVEVAHSGITPVLTERVAPGINPPGIKPTHIDLNLRLHDSGAVSTPKVETKEARFDKELAAMQKYSKASIYCENEEIASVPVEDTQ